MYLLYAAAVDAMDADYESQREKIELDQTPESNQYYLSYYSGLVSDYDLLIKSIESGKSMFSSGTGSYCSLLWNDYTANLDEYERMIGLGSRTKFRQCGIATALKGLSSRGHRFASCRLRANACH